MKKAWISVLCAIAVAAAMTAPALAAPAAERAGFLPTYCPEDDCSDPLTCLVRSFLCRQLGIGCVTARPEITVVPEATLTPGPTATSTVTTTARPTATPAATATPRPTATPTVTTTPRPTATPTVTTTHRPTATPTVKPTQQPAGPASSAVQTMLNLINAERAADGLSALTLDSALSAEALAHSRDMLTGGFFSHTSPTRGSFQARLSASGIRTLGAGENIAKYGSIEKAHAALMISEGHRANIMNKNYTHVGLGIVQSGGTYYITQWFARMG